MNNDQRMRINGTLAKALRAVALELEQYAHDADDADEGEKLQEARSHIEDAVTILGGIS